MKLLIVGDIHVRGTNPQNRKGVFFSDCLEKIQEVNQLAKELHAQVLQVGDIFDSPSASYGVFGEIAHELKSHTPWMTIPGNHDIFGHSLSTLPRTPYGALMSSGITQDVQGFSLALSDGFSQIAGVGFDYTLDRDFSEYKPEFAPWADLKILVVHGMLLPHTPPFDKFSHIDRVAEITTADVIISGHYHLPFIYQIGKKLFINPGALMRLSATEEEVTRTPIVVLLETETLQTSVIPLKCAKLGNEVLDRTAIEENKEREERMEQFISSLEFNSESRFMNLQEIIEKIATNEDIPHEIVRMSLQKLAEARERRG